MHRFAGAEELRRADQFGSFFLVTAELGDAAFDRVSILRVLVLDDAHRQPVDKEHHIRAVAFAGGWLQHPFPGNMKSIRVRMFEVDQGDAAMAFFGLVMPGFFAPQPRQHLAIALDRRGHGIECFDDGVDCVAGEPGVEPGELRLQLVAQQHARFAAALLLGNLGRERRPAGFLRMANHGGTRRCPPR